LKFVDHFILRRCRAKSPLGIGDERQVTAQAETGAERTRARAGALRANAWWGHG